jgi:prophage tail gpP-like protein
VTTHQTVTGDPLFEVVLERSGRVLRVEDYTFVSDFFSPSDAFSFTYYSEDPALLRGLEMQPVTLRIDGREQFAGRIEATDRGDKGSAVVCEGRDYFSDLVECNLDPKFFLRDGMNLEDAILQLVAPCGITTIETQGARISKRTGKPVTIKDLHLSAKSLKDTKPEAGKGIFETLESLLARFGYVAQPSTRRNAIVIQEPTYDMDSLGRITRTKGNPNKNLVLAGKARRDYSSFPTHAVFTGKQGTPTEAGGAKGSFSRWDLNEWLSNYPQEMRDILSGSIVEGRRLPGDLKEVDAGVLYRLLYFRDDKVAKTKEQLDNALIRAVSDRLKDTLRYSCTLRGHINPVTGYTWANDTIIDIDDDMADVHEPLWCHRVAMKNSRNGGPTAELEFIRPHTYQTFWTEDTGGTGAIHGGWEKKPTGKEWSVPYRIFSPLAP